MKKIVAALVFAGLTFGTVAAFAGGTDTTTTKTKKAKTKKTKATSTTTSTSKM
jgi:hypothetical protein